MEADARISRVFRELAEKVDKKLAKIAGEQMGFVIVTFPFDRTGLANYISNCGRKEAVANLRQLIDRLDPPHSKH